MHLLWLLFLNFSYHGSILCSLFITIFKFGRVHLLFTSLSEYQSFILLSKPFFLWKGSTKMGPHSLKNCFLSCLCFSILLPLKWNQPALCSIIQVFLEKARGMSRFVCILPHQQWSSYLECEPLSHNDCGDKATFPWIMFGPILPQCKIKRTDLLPFTLIS